jgi:hypothetical protein
MVGELRDDGEREAEKRALSVIHRFLRLGDHVRSAGSFMSGPGDSLGSHDWKLNADAALRRAAKSSGLPNYRAACADDVCREIGRCAHNLICNFIIRDQPHGSVNWAWRQVAIAAVLTEMDNLNRDGCPDNYDSPWGEACTAEYWERKRAARIASESDRRVARTVQAAEMTA